MIRETTSKKERKVVKEFQKLLRSGKDYTTEFMYSEAGNIVFLASKSAGNIVRRFYKNSITPEMCQFISGLNGASHEEKVVMFSKKFGMCKREGRLIIRYLK